jgi:transposase
MWTPENRPKYDRSKLRYPSDLTDEEWAIIAPLIPRAKRGGNRRTIDERAVLNGVMYILSTGCQWAALPKDLPPRSTVNDYQPVEKAAAQLEWSGSMLRATAAVCSPAATIRRTNRPRVGVTAAAR